MPKNKLYNILYNNYLPFIKREIIPLQITALTAAHTQQLNTEIHEY